jgi:hypothetical protein
MAQGGGSPTQSNVTSSTPWGPSQQNLIDNMAHTKNWLEAPQTNAIYGGTRVIPFSNQSLSGMNNAQNFAQTVGQTMQNNATGIIQNGGFNWLQNSAIGNMDKFANGWMNPNSAQANLSGMASGALLGQGNPYLQSALTNANERAATGVNSAMSASGRYGSGAHTDTLAKTLAENSTNAMFGQYNQDVANMMGANSQIDNVNQSNLGRQLGAAGNLFNAGQMGLGNMSNAYDTALKPTQTLGQIGGAYEDLAARYAQEQADKFAESRDIGINQIAKANAIYTGAGNLGSQTSSKVYRPTQWGQVGANAAGAALAGKG